MSNTAGPECRNALTVDVEDYFHASAFRATAPPEDWARLPARVERNTRKVLELLAESNTRATFFILGWVAERYPSLVREIQSAGHELGCHSYAHPLLYNITPAQFRADTSRALAAIEQASGVRARAYRAPSFSVTKCSLWALEILLELGFTMDSSIFPIRNYLYGIPTAPRQPFRIRFQGGELLEYPLPTLKFGGWNVPLTGGAYLRLMPWRVQIRGLRGMANRAVPVVLYFHPWELDPNQPRLAGAFGSRLYHYARLARTEDRLRSILQSFPFGTLSQMTQSTTATYEIAFSCSSKRKGPVFVPAEPLREPRQNFRTY
ncbi:MAG TPA: XrtA system polysaccharide deacetylase [Terriglobia bacterium]|nr:XrtA system polysaccharide deacetylase [Terriglobia bacterium]